MLKATGRYADAAFPAAIIDPKDYAAALDVVRAAASDAGHQPDVGRAGQPRHGRDGPQPR